MSVLVDTTIWSLALRRRRHQLSDEERRLVDEWRRLVDEGLACLIGPIRQEVLSGVKERSQFERLRLDLSGLDYHVLTLDDYDQAAAFYNTLRASGIAGGAVDLILCAAAYRRDLPIFTTDPDFERYAQHLPIRLHRLPSMEDC